MDKEERKRRKVSRDILRSIKNNYVISPHAKQRLKERVHLLYGNTNIKKFVSDYLKSKEKDAIYTYGTGRISIRKNKWCNDYMVFDYNKDKQAWVLVSYITLVKDI